MIDMPAVHEAKSFGGDNGRMFGDNSLATWFDNKTVCEVVSESVHVNHTTAVRLQNDQLVIVRSKTPIPDEE